MEQNMEPSMCRHRKGKWENGRTDGLVGGQMTGEWEDR